VQGIAAVSASGRYGEMRAAAAIVGSADLRLGDRVQPVLEAQIAASPQRFRAGSLRLQRWRSAPTSWQRWAGFRWW
jgi:L-fuconolactonase